MKTPTLRPALLALALAGLASPALALSILFRDVSTSGGMSADQLSAFQAAGNYWQGRFSDNVIVYIDIAFDSLGPNILASTGSSFVSTSYSSVRNRLVADAKSAADAVAVGHLPAAPALSFFATQGDLTSRFDNDGSLNNTSLGLTSANAKALGYAVNTDATHADASITFATGFAGDYVYTRVGGIPSNKTDFITVAEHEIGHALGFTSGVDEIDYCAGPNNDCRLPDTPGRFENKWWYQPLDLYRYSAPGVLDMRVGGSPYFSIDAGATSIETFSTGAAHGNGWQASHFGPGVRNLMRPFVRNGEFYDATANDLAALDVIGWDPASPVPEPRSAALLLAGLGVVVFAASRRR